MIIVLWISPIILLICSVNPETATEGTIHGSIWKNQQPVTVFLHDAKNHKHLIVERDNTRAIQKQHQQQALLQKVLVFSDGKQSLESCPIV